MSIHTERDVLAFWIMASATCHVSPPEWFIRTVNQWDSERKVKTQLKMGFFRWVNTTRLLVKYSTPFLNPSVISPFFPMPCSLDTKMPSGWYWGHRWPKIEDLYAVGLFQCDNWPFPWPQASIVIRYGLHEIRVTISIPQKGERKRGQ